jgi:hypothetical protein
MIARPPRRQQPPHRREAVIELAVVKMLDHLDQKNHVELPGLRGDPVHRPRAKELRMAGEFFADPSRSGRVRLGGRGRVAGVQQILDEKPGAGPVVDDAGRPGEMARARWGSPQDSNGGARA